MEAAHLNVSYYVICTLFFMYGIGRILLYVFMMFQLYYHEERSNWNSKINPFKIKICLFILPLLGLFFYFTYSLEFLSNTYFEQFLHIVSLIIICLLIEHVIRKPTKKYMTEEEIENSTKASRIFDDKHFEQMFRKGKETGLVDCEISDLRAMILGEDPKRKIIIKLKNKRGKNKKDRKSTANFINECTKGQFATLGEEEAVAFMTKYLDFNEENHSEENPYNPKNLRDWKKYLKNRVVKEYE